MMNSPSLSEVSPGPVTMSATSAVRSPEAPAITALAPLTIRAGTESAAGEALQRLPPQLDRFCIWSDPIRPLASERPGNAALNSSVGGERRGGRRRADGPGAVVVTDCDQSLYAFQVD